MNKRISLSIIIVNYRVDDFLIRCVSSIKNNIKEINYEVVVVENNPEADLSNRLKRFDFVKYIKPEANLGYGRGNNLGVKKSSGEFIFILNPDTEIIGGSISKIIKKLKDKKTGVIAPLLTDKKSRVYKLQGTETLTPLKAIFALSIINKVWSNNPISQKFWLRNTDRNKIHKVSVVPGTAFLIKRDLFEKIGMFDENMFLYFEESDLCLRLNNLGYINYITPDLKIKHFWGESTKKNKKTDEYFIKSRFYYFRKHFGLIPAFFTTQLMDINLNKLLFIIALAFGLFLRIDRPNLSMFIPDQGWFFLSARSMVLTGVIPLVGITSSHTWLHQGAFWTYLLAPFLSTFNFNPYAGFYLAVAFGFASMILVYKIGKRFINERFAMVSTFLYSASPLIVIHERMAYHTAPISFFCLLLIYSLGRWVRGERIFFPICLFIMSCLYNLELATVVFWPVIVVLFTLGYIKNKRWVKKLLNPFYILLSVSFFIVPMIPIIIYDSSHGFVQTIKYAAWLAYNPIISFVHQSSSSSQTDFVFFSYLHLQRLIFMPSVLISIILLVMALALIVEDGIKKIDSSLGILFLSTIFPLLGFLAGKTSSEAYLPMLFPGLILSFAYLIYSIQLKLSKIGFVLLFVIVILNMYSVYSMNYLIEKPFGYGLPLDKRVNAAREVIKLSNNLPYNLIYRSDGKQIKYSTENYDYLTAWLGYPPSKQVVDNKIIVYEGEHNIIVAPLSGRIK
ncbi:MAG TPA: glycosyltransferase [Patescibacteria group bacterium]|nr:glycosyltransferase [Patescibacteria group bacterium]